MFLKQWILFYLETILTCHVLPSETEVFPVNENMDSNEREELCKKGERVFWVRDGKYPSRARSKREKTKQNRAWQRRKWEEGLKNENFRVPEREELPQDMTRGEIWWEDSWTRTTEDARRGRGELKGSRIRKCEGGRTTASKQETDRGQQTISRGKYFFQRQGHGQFITFEVKTERSYRREIRAGRKNFTETNRS